ncbi:unnamed protein product [Rotaria socialis]|uniref:Uncharacterized protein n=1 Tax=Rotaria socialis TaxID=392032 RepID=A0A818AL97_9BILA|nr:unnamed protein product [Rotaria socialis]
MGVSAIKGAGKGVKTFATAMREQEIEQTTTKPVPGGNTAGLELVKARKKIITSLTMKQIAVLTNEKVLRKGLIKLVDVSSHFVLKRSKPQISDSKQDKILNKFFDSNLLVLICKMYALEKINKNQEFKGKRNKIVSDTFNCENSF